MGRGLKARLTKRLSPDTCAHQWVWMGSGGLKLEDGSVVIRGDKGGQPFVASWRWLMLKSELIGRQLLTVEQYEAKGFKLQPAEG